MKAGSNALSRTRNEDVHSGLPDLPNTVIDIIGKLSGWPVKLDPQKRVGDYEFQNPHAEWTRLSRGGRYKMTAEDYARNNEATGSSFYAPIFKVDREDCQNGTGDFLGDDRVREQYTPLG